MLKKEIIIYGTGSVAKEVISTLENRGGGDSLVAVANRGNQANVTGKTVCSLQDIDSIYYKKATVIICIFNVAVDIQVLQEEIAMVGFEDIVTYAELFELLEDRLNDNFYMTKAEKLLHYKSELEKVGGLWNDTISRQTFESFIKFRITKKYADLIKPEGIESQYFLNDLKVYPENVCFLDCGAYTGDTYIQLLNHRIPLEKYIAFEPDISNYAELVKEIAQNPIKDGNHIDGQTILIPCGTYEKTVQLSFSETGGSDSAINAVGDYIIQAIAIDDCLKNSGINVIKMDIEGAEYESLLGAEKVIKQNHPLLMICLYHKMEDIFRIPLLIESWNLNYKFYLRMHGESGFETVLYAV